MDFFIMINFGIMNGPKFYFVRPFLKGMGYNASCGHTSKVSYNKQVPEFEQIEVLVPLEQSPGFEQVPLFVTGHMA